MTKYQLTVVCPHGAWTLSAKTRKKIRNLLEAPDRRTAYLCARAICREAMPGEIDHVNILRIREELICAVLPQDVQ